MRTSKLTLEHVQAACEVLNQSGIKITYKSILNQVKKEYGFSASEATLAKFMKIINQNSPEMLLNNVDVLGQLEQVRLKSGSINPDNERLERIENQIADLKKQLMRIEGMLLLAFNAP